MKKSIIITNALLGVLLLTACNSPLESLSSEDSVNTSASSSEESLSSSEESSATSSEEISSSDSSLESSLSSSDSSQVIEQNQLVFARNITLPELPTLPLVETTLYMSNIKFRFNGVRNYATAELEGQSASFILYNIDSLDYIYSLELSLYQPKTNQRFTVYAGTEANPSTTTIPFEKIDALNYRFDFSTGAYTHFKFKNGTGVMLLKSITINFTKDFVFPEAPGTGGSGTVYDPNAVGYYLADPATQTIDPQAYLYQADRFPLNSIGEQKVLVVPVSFSDYRCTVSACEERRGDLQKAFFGSSEETGWESVSSYFYKSSYGKLTITGEVTPFYEAPYTANGFDALTRTTGVYPEYFIPTWQLADEVIAWYKTLPEANIAQYDQNGDGYVDALYMIYNNPNRYEANYSKGSASQFWAYVYWNYGNYEAWDNVETPDSNDALPMTYSFNSYDFMFDGYGSTQIDAHTYIHETGHILGLNDYYTYTANDWGAAGGLEMQDYNIMDHNPYSKFLLQWANPIVIDGTKEVTTIELNPFQENGDFILVNDEWNGSALDEYLALEFYTPTGLNEKDALAPYPGNNIQGFTESGIKLYHIDSRIGSYLYDPATQTSTLEGVTDVLVSDEFRYSYILTSNSSGRTDFPYFKQVHLLEADGVNTLIGGARATNAALFQEGDTFTPMKHFTSFAIFEVYSKDSLVGKFNDNNDIGYEIEILEITSTKAVVQLTRII